MDNKEVKILQHYVDKFALTFIEHHRCGVCDAPVGYKIDNTFLYYNSSCDCAPSESETRGWEELLKYLATDSDFLKYKETKPLCALDQEEQKLIAEALSVLHINPSDYTDYAVTCSEYGITVALSMPTHQSEHGEGIVYVLTRNDGTLTLVDTFYPRMLDPNDKVRHFGAFLTLSPDGTLLVVGSNDANTWVWEMTTVGWLMVRCNSTITG